MDQYEREGLERLRNALILDARINQALLSLGEDGKMLVRDSLASALSGECDEFFFQLFEGVIHVSINELDAP